MKIPINQFEQYINETILARGLSYFKNGYVNEPEEITNGLYEAVVEGTENYTVQLTLEKGAVSEYMCTCPYDHGPVCKHIAAVLFHISHKPTLKPKIAKEYVFVNADRKENM